MFRYFEQLSSRIAAPFMADTSRNSKVWQCRCGQSLFFRNSQCLACSALLLGNYFARVADSFDQESWDGRTWSDTISGNPASANYNQTIAPFVVTNRGAITERWALRFVSSTQVDVIGENVGNLGRFPINAEIAPINPTANAPYFSVKAAGWGAGWNAGNTLFIRTIGAIAPFNIVRTVQKGAATVQDDRFCIVARANVDRP